MSIVNRIRSNATAAPAAPTHSAGKSTPPRPDNATSINSGPLGKQETHRLPKTVAGRVLRGGKGS